MFYILKNTYHAQIEGNAFLNIRFGYTCLGIVYPRKYWKLKSWYLPHISFTFFSHSGTCNQYWIFKIVFGKRYFGFKTKGDADPSLLSYYNAGYKYKLF